MREKKWDKMTKKERETGLLWKQNQTHLKVLVFKLICYVNGERNYMLSLTLKLWTLHQKKKCVFCVCGSSAQAKMANRGGLLMVVWLWCSVISIACAARLGSESRQKLEVQKHLNRLNKSPVKSIKVWFFFFPLHVHPIFFILLSLSKSLHLFILFCLFGWWESERKCRKVKGKMHFLWGFCSLCFWVYMNKCKY